MEFLKKIKIITPPVDSGCGVADYSDVLIKNLNAAGLKAEAVSINNWGLKNFSKLTKKISLKHNEILHIQYPSQPYGKTILINLIGLRYYKKYVLTLHEYEQAHYIRKLSSLILCLCAKAVIFTNQNELNLVTKNLKFILKKSYLIKIGSNIPFKSEQIKHVVGPNVVFFGLIRPNKGLEQFLNLVEIFNDKESTINFVIIGSQQSGNEMYFEKMINKIKTLNVNLKLNQTADSVSEILSNANFAYLPYPDGVSERRGSFVAALGNSLIVISNNGINTTKELNKTFINCQTPFKAYNVINNAIAGGKIDVDANCVSNYLKDKNWFVITKKHTELYEHL